MEYKSFLALISDLDSATLGGLKSQFKMMPEMRKSFDPAQIAELKPRKAGVLALFYPNQYFETCFLLTLRANYKGVHAAQISFPGGKFELNDSDLMHTALRETYEEVGISKEEIHIKKELTETFIPPSNFLVSPFIGIMENTPKFDYNHEVKEIIEVKLADLLDENSLTIKNLSTSYMANIDVPCYKLNNYTVWGATAMILSEIKDLLTSI
jgi:8-oxo-dGTP pyrophosphatase MutT (NUDIX family)